MTNGNLKLDIGLWCLSSEALYRVYGNTASLRQLREVDSECCVFRLNIPSAARRLCGTNCSPNRGRELWWPVSEWHHFTTCPGQKWTPASTHSDSAWTNCPYVCMISIIFHIFFSVSPNQAPGCQLVLAGLWEILDWGRGTLLWR